MKMILCYYYSTRSIKDNSVAKAKLSMMFFFICVLLFVLFYPNMPKGRNNKSIHAVIETTKSTI